MNNIPKGYKLVPVDPTIEMLSAGLEALGGCVGSCGEASPPEHCDILDAFSGMLDAAPTPPQPIYDEARERVLFEACYSKRAKTLPLSLGNRPVRYAGGQYVNDFALFGWMVWLECAQSRAKAGEVDHE